MLHLRLMSLLAGIVFSFPGSVPAQVAADAFSAKPVVVIAPYEPGGPIDIEGRMYTKKATELTGQQFILDYKTGAATRIGAAYVAKSAADGHTLLINNTSFTALPVLFKNMPFDLIKDFAPVSHMSTKATMLLASPTFPAANFADFLAYAKANPGKVNFGTLGAGSTAHLIGAWLEVVANIKVTFIPYKGTGPQLLDMSAGRLDVAQGALIASLPFIKSGKLKALAVMDTRTRILPDVPAIAEQGIPGFSYKNWTGLFAPRATPGGTVARLSEILANVAKAPDIVSAADAQGNIMVGSSPAQFAQLVIEDTTRWQKLAQNMGIVLEE